MCRNVCSNMYDPKELKPAAVAYSQEAYARKRAHICKLWPTFFRIKSGFICFSRKIFLKESKNLTPGNLPPPLLFPRKRSINCNFPYLWQFFVHLNKIRLNFRVLDTKELIGSSLKCKFVICYVISLPWLWFAGASTGPHLFRLLSHPLKDLFLCQYAWLCLSMFWKWNFYAFKTGIQWYL